MVAFYHIFITIYAFAIKVASLFNTKAKLWIDGRKRIFEKVKTTIHIDDEIVWFHCASLGEFEQAKPFIEKFKIQYPNFKILVTFFSPSGYELRKKDGLLDYVFYLPIDSLKNAKTFISLIKPKMVFFVKYEFWYNYMNELKKHQIPVYLISGVFRENQLFFKWYGRWYKKVLDGFTHFFVQNEASKTIIISQQYQNVTLSGDTRFDRVYENSLNPKELPIIEAFKGNKMLIVGGSTWQDEEDILAKFNTTNAQFKLIVAPHNINKTHITQIVQLFKGNCLLYSNATIENASKFNVLIIDNIGILSNIYQYTDIAFIGGGFSGALHNVLEPVSFGNAIIIGPKHKKFHEAQDLINDNIAFETKNFIEFNTTINSIIPNLHKIKLKSTQFIKQKTGATDVILNFIKSHKK